MHISFYLVDNNTRLLGGAVAELHGINASGPILEGFYPTEPVVIPVSVSGVISRVIAAFSIAGLLKNVDIPVNLTTKSVYSGDSVTLDFDGKPAISLH